MERTETYRYGFAGLLLPEEPLLHGKGGFFGEGDNKDIFGGDAVVGD
jgi:hypothetical protein